MAGYKFMNESLKINDRVRALLKELTIDEKLGMLTTYSQPVERLGLKGFPVGTEVARGLVCRGREEYPSTVFPQPFGLAATFDPDVMHKMGEITGIETRIYNKQGKASLCVWGPTVDAERDPRWGRNEEAYGEDPYLIGQMSAAYTKGMAGDDPEHMRILPMLKHFYANNNEEDRGKDNASIPLGLKHDYYLKAFETAFIHGGAKGVMTSYNEINGVEALCNPELDEILKKQWGMLFSVTDGGDFCANVLSHKKDRTFAETAARVYKNHGADVMTDSAEIVRKSVKAALDEGRIDESDIDYALFGLLKARFLLGDIDGKSPYNSYSEDLLCCEDFYKVSERAAKESVILLKNSMGVLPFSPKKKTAVIGIHAGMNFRDWYTGLSDRNSTIVQELIRRAGDDNICCDTGCDIVALRHPSSGKYLTLSADGGLCPTEDTPVKSALFELYDWGDGAISLKSLENGKFLTDSGIMRCSADEVFGWFVHEMITVKHRGDKVIMYNWQQRPLGLTNFKLAVKSSPRADESCLFEIETVSRGEERAAELARSCQQAVVFAGNHPLINAREGYDRKHINLPHKSEKLLDAVLEVNKNTVLYMVSGYPYAFDSRKLCAAMHICHAGPAIGTAVCGSLFGDFSPAGRCPVTWYADTQDLCDIRDYNIIRTKSTYLYYTGKPLFPFGHGLSYASFEYGVPKLSARQLGSDSVLTVEIDIKNTGSMDADEVVQLYVAPPKLPIPLPKKQLKAFARIHVPKGRTETAKLKLDISDLGFYDVNTGAQEVYSGEYAIMIGSSSEDIRRAAAIEVTGRSFEGVNVSMPVPGTLSSDYMGVEFGTDLELTEYALIQDWQSFINYPACSLKGYTHAEVTAFVPGSGAELTLSCAGTGQIIAKFRIPGSGGAIGTGRFVTVKTEAVPIEGLHTLRFTTGGTVALSSFRLF